MSGSAATLRPRASSSPAPARRRSEAPMATSIATFSLTDHSQ